MHCSFCGSIDLIDLIFYPFFLCPIGLRPEMVSARHHNSLSATGLSEQICLQEEGFTMVVKMNNKVGVLNEPMFRMIKLS